MSHKKGKSLFLRDLSHSWATKTPEHRKALTSGFLRVNIFCSFLRFLIQSVRSLSDHLKMLSKHCSSGIFKTPTYAKQSFRATKIPITNKMLDPIWIINLNQEAIPGGSQLKISKNCEVSMGTISNHLTCAGFYRVPSLLHQRCFITRCITNRATHLV